MTLVGYFLFCVSWESGQVLAMTIRIIFLSLRAWPQGADSMNRAAISNVTSGLFQQHHNYRFLSWHYAYLAIVKPAPFGFAQSLPLSNGRSRQFQPTFLDKIYRIPINWLYPPSRAQAYDLPREMAAWPISWGELLIIWFLLCVPCALCGRYENAVSRRFI